MSDRERKILMIDADEQSLFALRAVFQLQRWASISATDVLTGLDLFRTEAPDLVLMEYHLPGINGIKGVEMIRELDAEVPIIVFTSEESQDVADRFFAAGASDFALKPIKAPDIVSRIRLHIRLLESNKRLNNKNEAQPPVHKTKGIGAVTLALIQGAFRTSAEYLTVETIAERTGLAYQTTYRYLQHLASQELLEICQNYGKVGRPKQKYRLKQQRSSV